MVYQVDRDLIVLFLVFATIVGGYFLSFQIQMVVARFTKFIESKIGVYTTKQEYAVQRYVYQHRSSIIARVYRWVNTQIIALGFKNVGVTPLGYLMFWGFASVGIALVVGVVTGSTIFLTSLFWIIIYVCLLILTRVLVSEKMEKRESDVMDAIDLIVPEIRSGVKNAILRYQDNFPIGIRDEFKSFVSNVQDRGYSFNDAMYILADNLGDIFYDFAQKAIFYEAIGEDDMIDIFSDILETNRSRRELRDENNAIFSNLKTSFVVSSLITFAYFIFIITTDAFSRNFFLNEDVGKVLLLVIIIIVFGVMAYVTTIKSRAL